MPGVAEFARIPMLPERISGEFRYKNRFPFLGFLQRASQGEPDLIGEVVYQSLPSTSPPSGVKALAQVTGFIPCAKKRTLPSQRPTFMPAVWPVDANRLSHG